MLDLSNHGVSYLGRQLQFNLNRSPSMMLQGANHSVEFLSAAVTPQAFS